MQGRRLFIYASDGQHFRTLEASSLASNPTDSTKLDMEPGIKSCQLSCDSELCAVGDHSRGVTVLRTGIWRALMSLWHPLAVSPCETLQVWQEQVSSRVNGGDVHAFLRAAQAVSPPSMAENMLLSVDARTGCSLCAFDASSTLLATRLDESPGTIWIWDLAAGELRAVIIFHSVISFYWHPTSRETLLISCREEGKHVASYVWDPLSPGPVWLDVEKYLPGCDAHGPRLQFSWLNHETDSPQLLVSDAQQYVLLSLADWEQEANPWQAAERGSESDGSASGRDGLEPIDLAEDISTLEDTFSFRHTKT